MHAVVPHHLRPEILRPVAGVRDSEPTVTHLSIPILPTRRGTAAVISVLAEPTNPTRLPRHRSP
ncbi:uncharacterized protein TRAVEDRAFT_32113 [Trametes versicolor FP-101664 SS1]|uniref:uncharacterized protein n=1 Tax=Trametes versicolor (strain FP-101664) TaxID=717944 RepID=UPI000462228D|nr:uncharacterized protein TRAVEDRAFT_32113 [Trametes versicolor FP-101664 SS1]EIW52390.1 hypothetical protein TRAVEDRAFT_32113 [Trametes versicolor FP-101664 SS1]